MSNKIWFQTFEILLFQITVNLSPTDMTKFWRLKFLINNFQKSIIFQKFQKIFSRGTIIYMLLCRSIHPCLLVSVNSFQKNEKKIKIIFSDKNINKYFFEKKSNYSKKKLKNVFEKYQINFFGKFFFEEIVCKSYSKNIFEKKTS